MLLEELFLIRCVIRSSAVGSSEHPPTQPELATHAASWPRGCAHSGGADSFPGWGILTCFVPQTPLAEWWLLWTASQNVFKCLK